MATIATPVGSFNNKRFYNFRVDGDIKVGDDFLILWVNPKTGSRHNLLYRVIKIDGLRGKARAAGNFPNDFWG